MAGGFNPDCTTCATRLPSTVSCSGISNCDVARNCWQKASASLILDVIDYRADERPLSGIARRRFDLGIDVWNAGHGIDRSMERIGMIQGPNLGQPVHDVGDA